MQFVDRTIPTPTETPVITLPKVSVSAKQTAVTEGANLVYTVSLDKAATSDLKIPYKLSGRATSADYTGATGFVTIPKGSTTADISLLTKDDGIAETGGETVILTLGATTEATIAKSSATARINDKVVPVTTGNEITITASAASVSNTSKVNATNVTTAGDDKITSSVANLANVTIDGGAGNDTLTLSDSGNFSIAESFELGLGLAVKNIEKLQLANGNNEVSIVFNTPGIFEINGGNGNDTISTLFSPKSNIINGGEGNDTILILGNNDTVTGGSGKDIFLIMSTSSSGSISKGTFTDFTSATDKFDFSAIKIPVSTTTSSNSSIVGAWKATTPFGDAVATFMSDGTYFYADPNGGAERGTYSWDSTKSSFSVTGNTFDTSNLGFYPSSTPTVVAFNGTSASWTVQGQKITASPIIDATKSIVGSWHGKELGQAGGDNVFTFLSDGTYYMVDNGDPALDPSGKKGMEKGTYTWDSTTGKLTTTTTVNTNGQWGFSDNAASGTTVTAKVTGDALLVTFTSPDGSGSGTLTKVISPTTSAPTTTTSMVNASVSFLGNKADFAQAQAAITANSDKLQVVYEQDKNILWADVNNDGVLNASDLQITLNGVNTLSAADFV